MKVKSNLAMLLYVKRIEQKTIAETLNLDQSTISRWLKNPTIEQQKKIMKAIEQIEGGVQDDEVN